LRSSEAATADDLSRVGFSLEFKPNHTRAFCLEFLRAITAAETRLVVPIMFSEADMSAVELANPRK